MRIMTLTFYSNLTFETLANRLAVIIEYPSAMKPFDSSNPNDATKRMTLNSSNDQWLHTDVDESNKFHLNFRYPLRDKQLDVLREFLVEFGISYVPETVEV